MAPSLPLVLTLRLVEKVAAPATRRGSLYSRAISSPSEDVPLDDGSAHRRRQGVVGIFLLILAEAGRVPTLADVVVVRTRPCEQWVGADALGRRLDQRPHDDAVVVGAGACSTSSLSAGWFRFANSSSLRSDA